MKNKKTRREFIKKSVIGTTGLTFAFSAKSYANIVGANDRVNLAVAGLNSRGKAHIIAAGLFKKDSRIIALCDVDNRLFDLTIKEFDLDEKGITKYNDVRKLLENQDIDALTIATPDHWHAAMAIMAMNAGKHVYLEKPFSHNPQEGEWLISEQKKTGMVLQIGNQQRSAPTSIEVIKEIREGLIGTPYYAKTWYSNGRETIGKGKEVPVPDWLDWELWQGPAPRRKFRDNWVHYDWHWFWHWGTGEINNNGLHELDIARWALGVDLPEKVTSTGGRYHFEDDWEFYDTQIAGFEFAGNKSITWEGRSCSPHPMFYGRGRGTAIHGTMGAVILDRNGYIVYDNENNITKQAEEGVQSATIDTVGIGGLDGYHFRNFLDGIQKDVRLNSPAAEAQKSTLLCHLGNMAQRFGGQLDVDPASGKPYSKQAMSLWSREYEPGWKPV